MRVFDPLELYFQFWAGGYVLVRHSLVTGLIKKLGSTAVIDYLFRFGLVQYGGSDLVCGVCVSSGWLSVV